MTFTRLVDMPRRGIDCGRVIDLPIDDNCLACQWPDQATLPADDEAP